MIKKCLLALVLQMVVFASLSFGQTIDQFKAERDATYAKYQTLLKPIIPSGWLAGDLIETKLRNTAGLAEDYLVLLAFKQNAASAKILVIKKVRDTLQKSWESTDAIDAADGLIGDMEFRLPMDINGESLDEIFVTFSAGKFPTQGEVSLWIYQWDGKKGGLLSPLDPDDKGTSLFSGSVLQPPGLVEGEASAVYNVVAGGKIYVWQSGAYTFWKDVEFTDEQP